MKKFDETLREMARMEYMTPPVQFSHRIQQSLADLPPKRRRIWPRAVLAAAIVAAMTISAAAIWLRTEPTTIGEVAEAVSQGWDYNEHPTNEQLEQGLTAKTDPTGEYGIAPEDKYSDNPVVAAAVETFSRYCQGDVEVLDVIVLNGGYCVELETSDKLGSVTIDVETNQTVTVSFADKEKQETAGVDWESEAFHTQLTEAARDVYLQYFGTEDDLKQLVPYPGEDGSWCFVERTDGAVWLLSFDNPALALCSVTEHDAAYMTEHTAWWTAVQTGNPNEYGWAVLAPDRMEIVSEPGVSVDLRPSGFGADITPEEEIAQEERYQDTAVQQAAVDAAEAIYSAHLTALGEPEAVCYELEACGSVYVCFFLDSGDGVRMYLDWESLDYQGHAVIESDDMESGYFIALREGAAEVYWKAQSAHGAG